MMEQREKLIELIVKAVDAPIFRNKSGCFPTLEENVADILIANGVVVLPCRCGECEHRGTDNCPMHIKGVPADEEFLSKVDNDFCSYGKRKGGDE